MRHSASMSQMLNMNVIQAINYILLQNRNIPEENSLETKRPENIEISLH